MDQGRKPLPPAPLHGLHLVNGFAVEQCGLDPLALGMRIGAGHDRGSVEDSAAMAVCT